jgi:hypothetical protein
MVLEDYLPIGVEHEWTCAIYRSRGKSDGYMEHEGQSSERVVEDVLCAPMASIWEDGRITVNIRCAVEYTNKRKQPIHYDSDK